MQAPLPQSSVERLTEEAIRLVLKVDRDDDKRKQFVEALLANNQLNAQQKFKILTTPSTAKNAGNGSTLAMTVARFHVDTHPQLIKDILALALKAKSEGMPIREICERFEARNNYGRNILMLLARHPYNDQNKKIMLSLFSLLKTFANESPDPVFKLIHQTNKFNTSFGLTLLRDATKRNPDELKDPELALEFLSLLEILVAPKVYPIIPAHPADTFRLLTSLNNMEKVDLGEYNTSIEQMIYRSWPDVVKVRYDALLLKLGNSAGADIWFKNRIMDALKEEYGNDEGKITDENIKAFVKNITLADTAIGLNNLLHNFLHQTLGFWERNLTKITLTNTLTQIQSEVTPFVKSVERIQKSRAVSVLNLPAAVAPVRPAPVAAPLATHPLAPYAIAVAESAGFLPAPAPKPEAKPAGLPAAAILPSDALDDDTKEEKKINVPAAAEVNQPAAPVAKQQAAQTLAPSSALYSTQEIEQRYQAFRAQNPLPAEQAQDQAQPPVLTQVPARQRLGA